MSIPHKFKQTLVDHGANPDDVSRYGYGYSKTDLRRIEFLPYGMRVYADGREELFNREYRVIWERMPGEPAKKVSPRRYSQDPGLVKTVFFNETSSNKIEKQYFRNTVLDLGYFISGEKIPETLWIAAGPGRPQVASADPEGTQP